MNNRQAWLQHGTWGGPYLTEAVPLRETEHLPRKGQTLEGYGSNLPTHFQVQWRGRWYRVKSICYSNSGSLYIASKQEGKVVRILVTIQ